jgi:beta-galactosidase
MYRIRLPRGVGFWAAVTFAIALSGCYVAIGFDGAIVGTALDIRQQPKSQTVLVGLSASFAVGVAGASPITYQWRRNGADIAGANDFTYITPPAMLADDGTLFTVRVCNDVVCLDSSPALLTVLPR